MITMFKMLTINDVYLYKKTHLLESRITKLISGIEDIINETLDMNSLSDEEMHGFTERLDVLSKETKDIKKKLQTINYKIRN